MNAITSKSKVVINWVFFSFSSLKFSHHFNLQTFLIKITSYTHADISNCFYTRIHDGIASNKKPQDIYMKNYPSNLFMLRSRLLLQQSNTKHKQREKIECKIIWNSCDAFSSIFSAKSIMKAIFSVSFTVTELNKIVFFHLQKFLIFFLCMFGAFFGKVFHLWNVMWNYLMENFSSTTDENHKVERRKFTLYLISLTEKLRSLKFGWVGRH